ncbi:MAG: hypothetical protein AAGE03_04060 [Pseudomonadota bacterium]
MMAPTLLSDAALAADHLARLCRVTQAARADLVDRVVGWQQQPVTAQRDGRTCIEGDAGLLVTLRADKHVGLHAGLAVAEPRATADAPRRWRRVSIDAPDQTGRSLFFGRPSGQDLERALADLEPARPHAAMAGELLARGTIYMTTARDPGDGSGWLSVQLHRANPLRTTLAALGRPGLWPQVASQVEAVLGRPVIPALRPWSVALPVSGEARARGLIRIGTTAWSRMAQTSDKSRRLAQTIAAFGGAVDRARSLYAFACARGAGGRPVGSAVEFDFDGDRPVAVQFVLRLPSSETPTSIQEL